MLTCIVQTPGFEDKLQISPSERVRCLLNASVLRSRTAEESPFSWNCKTLRSVSRSATVDIFSWIVDVRAERLSSANHVWQRTLSLTNCWGWACRFRDSRVDTNSSRLSDTSGFSTRGAQIQYNVQRSLAASMSRTIIFWDAASLVMCMSLSPFFKIFCSGLWTPFQNRILLYTENFRCSCRCLVSLSLWIVHILLKIPNCFWIRFCSHEVHLVWTCRSGQHFSWRVAESAPFLVLVPERQSKIHSSLPWGSHDEGRLLECIFVHYSVDLLWSTHRFDARTRL